MVKVITSITFNTRRNKIYGSSFEVVDKPLERHVASRNLYFFAVPRQPFLPMLGGWVPGASYEIGTRAFTT